VLGPDVGEFEDNFATYTGSRYAVGVSNGTDALKLCFECLELSPNTGIIIQGNTYVATALAARYACPNAEIILCEVDDNFQTDTNKLKSILDDRRIDWVDCVICPVHMYGSTNDMTQIEKLSREHNSTIVEDCSQAHGAISNTGRHVGTSGAINAFSCYPGKNLGAAGDAGVITTNSTRLYESACRKRNLGLVQKHHHEVLGHNMRLDSLQAIILDEKLKLLDEWNNRRIKIAERYMTEICNPDIELIPKPPYCNKSVYHIFSILCKNRKAIEAHLGDNGIQTGMHYPIPIENTEMFLTPHKSKNIQRYSSSALSLPIYPHMPDDHITHVIDSLNACK
jgi:dTDP-4-amino-4,6-dideoxygalactose transaminase